MGFFNSETLGFGSDDGFRSDEERERFGADRDRTNSALDFARDQIQGLPEEVLNRGQLDATSGRFRATADARANAGLASLAQRQQGDTSSAQFQLLSSGITGGAASDAATARQDLEFGNAQAGAQLKGRKAQAALGLGSLLGQRDIALRRLRFDRERFQGSRPNAFQRLQLINANRNLSRRNEVFSGRISGNPFRAGQQREIDLLKSFSGLG
jgi:hypothetical protein